MLCTPHWCKNVQGCANESSITYICNNSQGVNFIGIQLIWCKIFFKTADFKNSTLLKQPKHGNKCYANWFQEVHKYHWISPWISLFFMLRRWKIDADHFMFSSCPNFEQQIYISKMGSRFNLWQTEPKTLISFPLIHWVNNILTEYAV